MPQRITANVSRFPRTKEKETGNIAENVPSFIDKDIFNQSLAGYDRNTFASYLADLFGPDTADNIISRYRIGTSKHWPGSTIFWQIDVSGNIRAGKIMLYDETGHRVKNPFNHVTWVHKALKIDSYYLKQCLFGEHLLKGSTSPVAIVESEKTACIASIYLPSFIWLACGQKNGLNIEKCKVLAGRTVMLYPDLGAFDVWNQKAEELQAQIPGSRFVVSDLLERKATDDERANGLDLADYLIRFDIIDFQVAAAPRWYVDMQGVLRRYQAREITGDQFLDLQDENWKQSGLSGPEYVRQANKTTK